MKNRFFITGTDTGVGKTHVLSLLLKQLKESGFSPTVIKPIETGCAKRDGNLIPEDATLLAKIACMEDIDIVCPYRFEHPVAPYVASKLEKKRINIKKIKSILDGLSEPVFVEGAGGLMVPILKNFFMIDLAKYLDLDVIFVASLRLGTINHTLLSLEALKRRKIAVRGIILNDIEGVETIATKTNFQIIKELTNCPILSVIPFGKNVKPIPNISKFLS